MRAMMKILGAAGAVLVLAQPALAQPALAETGPQLPRGLAALTPQEAGARVTGGPSGGGSQVILSTEAVFRGGQSLRGAWAPAVHLTAAVDQATGAARWQVWHEIVNFPGKGRVEQVRYAAGGTAATGLPARVERWHDVCPLGDSAAPCHANMRVVVDLPEAALREIAAMWQPRSRTGWPLSFVLEGGRELTGAIAPAEAAGLVAAVDALRAGRPAATPPA